jgi:hypothetical protein
LPDGNSGHEGDGVAKRVDFQWFGSGLEATDNRFDITAAVDDGRYRDLSRYRIIAIQRQVIADYENPIT